MCTTNRILSISNILRYGIIAGILATFNFNISADTTPDFTEGWYQIKRTINIAELADMEFGSLSAWSGMSSLFSNVSYLTTDEEFTSNITIPILNTSAGTAVYGARLTDVDGTKDYMADLTSTNGRNANESLLNTYFYITPIEADEDGEWQYTVRSVNGHYMAADGRFYAEPQTVYFNSSIGISLGESLDASLKTMLSSFGVSIGSKQYTLTASSLENIPFIKYLDVYTQLQSMIEMFGDMGVKFSTNSWTKRTVNNSQSADNDSITCIASPNIIEKLYSIAQDAGQLIEYYNDSDYSSFGRLMMKHVSLDIFKIKKINISNITTSVGLTAKHTSVTPYSVNLIGFGDNFSLSASDFRTIDALTQLNQKTNQNAMVEYTGTDAQSNSVTRFYDGGTLFIKKGGSAGYGNDIISLITDNGTDLINLSKAQYATEVDNNAKAINIYISSPKQREVLGIPTDNWSDNYKTVAIGATGYTTLYSPFELIIPEAEKNIFGTIKKNAPKAYTADYFLNNDIHCSSVNETIPAFTPVIISGDKNQSYTFTVSESTISAISETDDLLSGTFSETTIPEGTDAYIISTNEDGSPVFTLLDSEDRTIPAWSAYVINAPSSQDYFNIIFNDSLTGVQEISTENSKATYYNLQGIPVANPVAGEIYIRLQGKTATKIIL